jgi:hypothetical protein
MERYRAPITEGGFAPSNPQRPAGAAIRTGRVARPRCLLFGLRPIYHYHFIFFYHPFAI